MTLFPSPLVASSPTNQKEPRSPVDLESGCGRMERLVEGRRGVMEGGFADCKADVPEGFIVFGPSANPPSTHTLHTHTHSLSSASSSSSRPGHTPGASCFYGLMSLYRNLHVPRLYVSLLGGGGSDLSKRETSVHITVSRRSEWTK